MKFCHEHNIQPLQPQLTDVLEYLTSLFDKGLGYSSLNSARSALSTLIYHNDVPIGQHPMVKRLMKGVFNLRPALPRNTVCWDVGVLLNYIKLLTPITEITLKELTHKCVSLLGLLMGARVQTLHTIHVHNIAIAGDRMTVSFGDILKQSRPGVHQGQISFRAYSADTDLCIIRVMQEYLRRTSTFRLDNHLFLSYQKPHNAVNKDTIARWIKASMQSAGIDTTMFTPHSLRSASTSAAKRAHVPIATILATGGWSSESTFRRFYDKPIINDSVYNTSIIRASDHKSSV